MLLKAGCISVILCPRTMCKRLTLLLHTPMSRSGTCPWWSRIIKIRSGDVLVRPTNPGLQWIVDNGVGTQTLLEPIYGSSLIIYRLERVVPGQA